jgi:hypothetical protein
MMQSWQQWQWKQGNLAQKYLWQALFENSLQLKDAPIAVFAAATRPAEQGECKWKKEKIDF